MKLLVRNLSRSTSQQAIEALFSQFGEVIECTLVMDPVSGGSKGFGFVEMSNDEQGLATVSGLNQSKVDGMKIRVKVADQ